MSLSPYQNSVDPAIKSQNEYGSHIQNLMSQREDIKAKKMKNEQTRIDIDDYTSQAAKDLRYQKDKADMAASKAVELQSSFVNENPDLARHAYTSGLQANIDASLTKASDSRLERIGSTFADAKDPEKYKAAWTDAFQQDPEMVSGLPSPTEYASDPRAKAKADFMVSRAVISIDQRQKERVIAIQQGNELGQIGARGAVESSLASQKFGYDKDLLNIKEAGDTERTNIAASSRLESAEIKNSRKSLAKAPPFDKYGISNPNTYVKYISKAITGFDLEKEKMPETDRAALQTDLFEQVRTIFTQQWQEHAMNDGPVPTDPSKVTQILLERAARNGQIAEEGSIFKEKRYFKEGSKEHIQNWATQQAVQNKSPSMERKLPGIMSQLDKIPGAKDMTFEEKSSLVIKKFQQQSAK